MKALVIIFLLFVLNTAQAHPADSTARANREKHRLEKKFARRSVRPDHERQGNVLAFVLASLLVFVLSRPKE